MCRSCDAYVVLARIEGGTRWALFDASPIEHGGFVFVEGARVPMLRADAAPDAKEDAA